MGCGTEREEEVGGAEDGSGNHGAIESELLRNGLGSSSCLVASVVAMEISCVMCFIISSG